MAKINRLSPNQLAELKSGLAGLKGIDGYAPVNAEYAVKAIEPIETEIDELTEQESQLTAQLTGLRDRIAERGRDFQQAMKGAAQQVVAQFGDDSAEIQALGRKRLSDRTTRKPKVTG